jgi:hypothetical protein
LENSGEFLEGQEGEETEEDEEDDDDDENMPGDEIQPPKRNKRNISEPKALRGSKKRLSEDKLEKMKEIILKEKQAIIASKDLEESEKNRLLIQAEERVLELENERAVRQELTDKLAQMEQKLLFGGVNIIGLSYTYNL